MDKHELSAREVAVRRWFGMWLEGSCKGIEELFSPCLLYTSLF